MRYFFLFFSALAISANAIAQDSAGNAASQPSNKDIRKQLIKSALAPGRGSITVMEAVPGDGRGVILGHGSGALLNCYGDQHCREFKGTPNEPVVAVSVSRRGNAEIIWAAYPHGNIYRCVDYYCAEFKWVAAQKE